MHDRVHGQRQLVPHDLGRERALARKRAVIARDVVGGGGLAVLDGDLHVIEPGRGERAQFPLGDADCGGDEIGVEPGRVRARRDIDEIAARPGLAAREVDLQDPERRGLTEHADPGRGVELVFARIERERVGAIGATERTAVGQLGEQAERTMQGNGIDRHHVKLALQSLWPQLPPAAADPDLPEFHVPAPPAGVARLRRRTAAPLT
jgi:hypothetical protein